MKHNLSQARAFLPLLLFVGLFLGMGIYYHLQGVEFAFYQLPAPVAALPAAVLAIWFAKGTIDERVEEFSKGMGDVNVISMCLIYLLAGAFSILTKNIGAVEAVVQLGINIFPPTLLLPGIFLLAGALSLAMGTSMGTISAVGPIAAGMADKTGIPMPLLFGALIGGATFGDNLSMISDTTIAATKTQGAQMMDKIRENFKFALPAALMTVIYLSLQEVNVPVLESKDVDWVKVFPYALLLVLALSGLNVFLVLLIGIVSAGVVGFIVMPNYGVQLFGQGIYEGFKDMQEIFLLSLLMGGLGRMMKLQGGITLMQNTFEKITLKLSRGGRFHRFFSELSLAASVTLADLAVANNTVAILICGDFFREVSQKENISPKRSASILDVFACITQGIIPYGAQILLASQLSKVSPLVLAGQVTYCYLLLIVTLIFMFAGSWKRQVS